MEKIQINNSVLIGEWEDVKSLPVSVITKRDEDKEILDGLIIKGYETKFGEVNENGERYEQGCLDAFIQRYFVEKGMNIPVDIQHRDDLQHLCGRVIYCEVNTTGFYFVVYVPRSFVNFETLKNLLKEGIIQGFSKYGFATDYDFDNAEVMHIREFALCAISLVSTPANALPFESVSEIKNRLVFENKTKRENKEKTLKKFFNFNE